MVARPGDFITTSCRRCNDVTGHVVMVVLDGSIMKVECKACGSVHKYREAKVPSAKAVAAPAKRASSAPKALSSSGTQSRGASSLSRTGRGVAAKVESAWQEAMVRHNADTPKPYSMHEALGAGEFVEHPSFGRGEVIRVTRPDKAEILFREGVKILRCKV